MGSFWSNFSQPRTGERKRGLGRWFQILEERFMALFWTNLLLVAMALPLITGLFFFAQLGDSLSLAWVAVGLLILSPGLTAANFLTMQIIRDKPVDVWRDFWKSVRRDWKQSVGFGAAMGLLWGAIVYAMELVTAVQGGLGLMYTMVFFLCGFLATGLTALGFQQIAMVVLPFFGVFRNAFLLIFAGRGRSLGAVLVTMLLVGLCLWFYRYFVFLLVLGTPVLIIMTANLITYPVFASFFPEDETP